MEGTGGLRRTLRGVRSAWGFHALAVGSLGVGIGAAATAYAVVDRTLFDPLPYPHPERLTAIYATLDGDAGEAGQYLVSPANFLGMAAEARTLDGLAALRAEAVDVAGAAEPMRVAGARVTSDLFTVLGVAPVVGRTLLPGDGEAVAVLSAGLWTRHFGADPSVIGRVVRLDGEPHEIVGVIADGLGLPTSAEVWRAWDPGEATDQERHGGFLQVVGRVAPGRTVADARRDLDGVARALEARYPEHNGGRGIGVEPLREAFVGEVRDILGVLLGAAGVFLAIGCTNAAGLFMVRGDRTARLHALKAALGASRARLVADAAAEAGVTAVGGCVLGAGVAAAAAPFVLAAVAPDQPVQGAAVLEPRVLVFTAALTLLVTGVSAMLPAALAAAVEPGTLLREGRGRAGGRGETRFQAAVVFLQGALSVGLTVLAADMVVQVQARLAESPGYEAAGAVTVRVGVPDHRYPSHAERHLFLERVGDALRGISGVAAAGASDVLPVGDPGVSYAVSIEDLPPADPTHFHVTRGRLVTPGYLEALGVPLLAGRRITGLDRADAPPAVVVSRSFAERFWPGGEAVGRRLKRRTYGSPFPWMTVVGVVDDVREAERGDLADGVAIYLPYAQHDTRLGREMSFVVRAEGREPLDAARDARARIAAVDPQAPVVRVATLVELGAAAYHDRRVAGRAASAMALGGLLLLGLGVYGVTARAVEDRAREMTIRRVLGAPIRTALLPAVRTGLVPLGLGAAVAAAAVWMIAPVSPGSGGWETPAWLYALAAGLALAVGGVAAVPGMRRAAADDPAGVLRQT